MVEESDKLENYSAILTELRNEDYQQPSKMLPSVKDDTGIARSNFYDSLDELEEEGLVKQVDGPGRATLYTLTEEGEDASRLAMNDNLDEEYLELIEEFGGHRQKMVSVHSLLEETNERNEAENLVNDFYQEGSVEEELFSAYIESEF